MQKTWMKRIRIFLAALVVGALIACGGAPAPGGSEPNPGGPPPPPPGPSAPERLDPPPAAPSNTCALGEVIHVPDANLRTRLQGLVRNLPTESDDLTCENLALIGQLNIWSGDRVFTTLEGLQYLVGATSISWEEVTFPAGDIMYLAGMTSLERVGIRDSEPAYVHFAEHLEHLEELNFRGSIVDDLSPLAGHPTLERLSITGGNITSVDAIGEMPALTYLHISENPITELGGLTEAPALEELWIDQADLTDVTGLHQLTKLTSLRINQTPLTEGDFSGMPAIRTLNLAANAFEKVPTLPNTSLQELVLSSNGLNDLAGIQAPGSIRYVRLQSNQIPSIHPIAFLTGIQELHLEDNPFQRLDTIADDATNVFNSGATLYLQNTCALDENGNLHTNNHGAELKLRGHNVQIITGGVPRARSCL